MARYGRRRYRYRRRRMHGVSYRRFRRRYGRRRSRGTKGAVVKLTFALNTPIITGNQPMRYIPFNIQPSAFPGFRDYANTNTHYRILSAKLKVSRYPEISHCECEDTQTHEKSASCQFDWRHSLMVVPSRSFIPLATGVNGTNGAEVGTEQTFGSTVSELAQARYQKLLTPSSTATHFRVGFRPYYVFSQIAPSDYASGVANPTYTWRTQSARRWMAISYAGPCVMYGPYMVPLNASFAALRGDGNDAASYITSLNVWVTAYFQFKGQR
ncbi:capsid protein [Myodefec virus RodL3_976]|uniref:Capsid protein n=1 Tax=Myodefec virus RodL3_976 TaxID=2929259 RepID=A0A976N1K0_9VIRU|nr:capsid protein [Myodefec virus RodL3_976]